jgi:general secretion pathway protein D
MMLALGLTACATPPASTGQGGKATEPQQASAGKAESPGQNLALSTSPLAGKDQADLEALRKKVLLFPGTGKFLNSGAATKPPAAAPQGQGEITLNFEGASIRDVVKVIFDTLQENYVIDPQVQGEVTVQTSRSLPKDMLIPTLEMLLGMNQAALVREGGIYKIVPMAGAAAGVSPRLGQARQGYGVRIVPLRYIGVAEMQKILEPFIPQGGLLRADPARNLLMLGGTGPELSRLQETIDIFDVNWLKGMSIGLYKLQNVDSQTVAAQLDKMFGETSKLPMAGMFRFLAVNQLNAVLVITPQAEYLREASAWVERLDGSGGERLRVYSVQNGKADYLAAVLNAVFGGAGAAPSQPPPGQVAPGLQPVQLSVPSGAEQGAGSYPQGASGAMLTPEPMTGTGTQLGGKSGPSLLATPPSSDKGAAAVRAAELGKGTVQQVRVVADTENNALLIWANAQNYEKIINALSNLDVTPRQVLVEATIAEVTLSGELSYGLEWYFKNNFNGYSGYGSFDLGTNVQLNQVLGDGFAYAITDKAGLVHALLQALASESKLKVLSSPQLMVVNNQEASILVGTQQPVLTGTTITTGGNTVQSLQYKDTGVMLQVRPQVNAGGLVTMDIAQSVTAVGPIDAATRQRSFDQRSIKSRVSVQSGESIFLGGLIQDRQLNSDRGIPVLYKLPVIGSLFGKTDDSTLRTELVVLLTPRVIETSKDAQQVIDDLRRRMREVAPMMVNS